MIRMTLPKTAALALAAFGPTLAPLVAQQQVDQATLIERRAEKLKKPFLTHAPWTTDYDAARQRAKDQNKLIFAYFTRSYAH